MYAGNPILDEIKKGFKLRKTVTVDKSKPIFIAEGEDTTEIDVSKNAPSTGIAPPGKSLAQTPSPSFSFIPPPIPGGIPPPPPPMAFSGGIPPPPPPPMGVMAPPPPPTVARPKTPVNPALAKLGGKTPGTVDRGEFLKGIQGGFKLKKVVTTDKSGLFVDDEMRERSVTLIEATPSTYIPPPSRNRSPRPHSSLGFDSEDNRFHTPEPRDDSPEQLLGQRRPIVMRRKGDPPAPPPEFGFDSEKQKITSEDIEKEIKKGSVASKMAALMGNMGYSADKCDAVGTGTLPRATFRRSPLRSSMMSSSSEVNNNRGDYDETTPKPKPVSKWHVDTNYGLKSASRSNVPLEKEKEEPRASSVMRDRSSSWLDLTRPATVERARTQSPIPLCERLELDEMDFDELVEREIERRAAAKAAGLAPKTRRKSKVLPEPISVNTTLSAPPPVIQETPPTPAQKKTYGYMTKREEPVISKATNTGNRPTTPSTVSPISSAPSPSSLSAGSVSPDTVPKKRVDNAFEKTKEKWGAPAATTPSPSVTPTREVTPTKKVTPVVNAPCFAVTPGEAKGAAAVAKEKSKARKKKAVEAQAEAAEAAAAKVVAPTPINTTPITTPVVAPTKPKPKPAYGQPQTGTVADRANKFKQQLQADEDKGKKSWQRSN